jgi:hypothetical protein
VNDWEDNQQMIGFEGTIKASSGLAVMFVHDRDEEVYWLPISQIDCTEGNLEPGERVIIEVPKWMADNKRMDYK